MELALNSLSACVPEKMKMGVSNFDVFAQIWAVGTNLKIQSNRNFNVDKEKLFTCYDFFDSC